eukprot:9151584-Lingulodinium_polyedra.AAC.1
MKRTGACASTAPLGPPGRRRRAFCPGAPWPSSCSASCSSLGSGRCRQRAAPAGGSTSTT